jgi:hypothetical protein
MLIVFKNPTSQMSTTGQCIFKEFSLLGKNCQRANQKRFFKKSQLPHNKALIEKFAINCTLSIQTQPCRKYKMGEAHTQLPKIISENF